MESHGILYHRKSTNPVLASVILAGETPIAVRIVVRISARMAN